MKVRRFGISRVGLKSRGYDAHSTKFFVGLFSHELGHCLGLLHPQETDESVLTYFGDGDGIRLFMDDKIGITYLYPAPGVSAWRSNYGLSCATE